MHVKITYSIWQPDIHMSTMHLCQPNSNHVNYWVAIVCWLITVVVVSGAGGVVVVSGGGGEKPCVCQGGAVGDDTWHSSLWVGVTARLCCHHRLRGGVWNAARSLETPSLQDHTQTAQARSGKGDSSSRFKQFTFMTSNIMVLARGGISSRETC